MSEHVAQLLALVLGPGRSLGTEPPLGLVLGGDAEQNLFREAGADEAADLTRCLDELGLRQDGARVNLRFLGALGRVLELMWLLQPLPPLRLQARLEFARHLGSPLTPRRVRAETRIG